MKGSTKVMILPLLLPFAAAAVYLGAEPVKVRRTPLFAAVEADIPPAHIVRVQDHQIRPAPLR